MRRLALSAMAAWCLVSVITAQSAPGGQAQPPSTTGVVVKGKAPVSNEILKVALPKPQEADLPNGLHLMVLEDRRLPRVTFQIIIPGAGGYFDPPALIGLSTYTAQMMREGTSKRSSQQISQELETMSASVVVGSSLSGPFATVSGNALTENLPRLFDLTADVLLNASFPADEWERLKVRTRAGLIQQRTQPGFLSAERFSKVIFGDHPAGRVSATPETLNAITREAMVEYHKTAFRTRPRPRRLCRRHQPGRGAQDDRDDAGGMEEKRHAEPGDDRTAAARTGKGLPHRAPRLGADNPDGGHAVDGADRSGLRAADRRQPRARRHDGPALHAPARGEGLHLRDRQRLFRDCLPRSVVGVDRRSDRGDRGRAHRSAGRDRRHARQAGTRERAAGRQASDRRELCEGSSRTRRRCWTTTCRTGSTGCLPITGTPTRRESMP